MICFESQISQIIQNHICQIYTAKPFVLSSLLTSSTRNSAWGIQLDHLSFIYLCQTNSVPAKVLVSLVFSGNTQIEEGTKGNATARPSSARMLSGKQAFCWNANACSPLHHYSFRAQPNASSVITHGFQSNSAGIASVLAQYCRQEKKRSKNK